jgi:hypothetical protein
MTRRRKQSEITAFTKTNKEVKYVKKIDKKSTPNKGETKKNDRELGTNKEIGEAGTSGLSQNSMDTEVLNNTNTSTLEDFKNDDTINFDDPIYGDSSWCASRQYCKCTDREETYNFWCKICTNSAHIECLLQNENESSDLNNICIHCYNIKTSEDKTISNEDKSRQNKDNQTKSPYKTKTNESTTTLTETTNTKTDITQNNTNNVSQIVTNDGDIQYGQTHGTTDTIQEEPKSTNENEVQLQQSIIPRITNITNPYIKIASNKEIIGKKGSSGSKVSNQYTKKDETKNTNRSFQDKSIIMQDNTYDEITATTEDKNSNEDNHEVEIT